MDNPLPQIPPMRPGLVIEEEATGGGHLLDPMRRRRIRLDARGIQVLRLMDRAQTPDELLLRVAATGRPMATDALERVLAAFASLGILAPEDGPELRDPGEIDPETVPLLIDSELRFTCTACGSCCCGVNIPFDRLALQKLDAERVDVLKTELGLDDPPVIVLEGEGQGVAMPLCRTRNGACVFLEGRLCALHRRWGADSKPLVCRAFPFELMRTPRGVTVGLQLECRDLMRAGRGQPLREQEAAVRAVLAQAGPLTVARDEVSLDGRTFLSYTGYESLEDEVVAAIEACPDGGFESLATAGRILARRCASSGNPLPTAEEDPGVLRGDLLELFKEIVRRLAALRGRLREEGAGLLVRTVSADAIQLALTEMPQWMDKVLESDEEGDSRWFARLCARNAWRGKEVLRPSDLVTGQALAVLRWFLARAGAISTARQASRAFFTPQDLLDAWVRAHFLLRNQRVSDALAPLRNEFARLLVAGLPAALAARARMGEPDHRSEFHLL